jgi:hypothetical protein
VSKLTAVNLATPRSLKLTKKDIEVIRGKTIGQIRRIRPHGRLLSLNLETRLLELSIGASLVAHAAGSSYLLDGDFVPQGLPVDTPAMTVRLIQLREPRFLGEWPIGITNTGMIIFYELVRPHNLAIRYADRQSPVKTTAVDLLIEMLMRCIYNNHGRLMGQTLQLIDNYENIRKSVGTLVLAEPMWTPFVGVASLTKKSPPRKSRSRR